MSQEFPPVNQPGLKVDEPQVESEVREPNVSAYIEAHKGIAATLEDLKKAYFSPSGVKMMKIFEDAPPGTGELLGAGRYDSVRRLYFKGTSGDLFVVDIDVRLIDSLKDKDPETALEKELAGSGNDFKLGRDSLFGPDGISPETTVEQMKANLAQRAAAENPPEFKH